MKKKVEKVVENKVENKPLSRERAYVTYKEYLELPAFKRYVAENGVVLPKKLVIADASSNNGQQTSK